MFAFVDGLNGLFAVQSNMESPNAQIKAGGANAIQGAIMEGLKRLKGGGKCLLVIDGLDIVLAAGGEACTTSALHDMLMELRQVCYLSRRLWPALRNRMLTLIARSCDCSYVVG